MTTPMLIGVLATVVVVIAALAAIGLRRPSPAARPDAELVWTRHHEAGIKACNEERYPTGVAELKTAIKVAEQFGKEDRRLAASVNALGELYNAQGEYMLAAPMFKWSLEIEEVHVRRRLEQDEMQYGSEHRAVAATLDELAAIKRRQNDDGEAERLLRRALAIKEKTLPSDHPGLAVTLGNLAEVCRSLGKYGETQGLVAQAQEIEELLVKRAMDADEEAVGPNSPIVATNLSTLAELYRSQERYDQAEPLYQRIVQIWEEVFGPEHPQVATALRNYAAMLRKMGRIAEAGQLAARAKTIDASGSDDGGA